MPYVLHAIIMNERYQHVYIDSIRHYICDWRARRKATTKREAYHSRNTFNTTFAVGSFYFWFLIICLSNFMLSNIDQANIFNFCLTTNNLNKLKWSLPICCCSNLIKNIGGDLINFGMKTESGTWCYPFTYLWTNRNTLSTQCTDTLCLKTHALDFGLFSC